MILELSKDLMSKQGKLKLVRPDAQVFDTFKITGLSDVFDFYLTASEAILPWLIPQGYRIVKEN